MTWAGRGAGFRLFKPGQSSEYSLDKAPWLSRIQIDRGVEKSRLAKYASKTVDLERMATNLVTLQVDLFMGI